MVGREFQASYLHEDHHQCHVGRGEGDVTLVLALLVRLPEEGAAPEVVLGPPGLLGSRTVDDALRLGQHGLLFVIHHPLLIQYVPAGPRLPLRTSNLTSPSFSISWSQSCSAARLAGPLHQAA